MAQIATALLALLLAALTSTLAFAGAAPNRLGPEALTAMAREWLADHFSGEMDPETLELAGPPRELVLPAGNLKTQITLQSGSVAAGTFAVLVEAAIIDGPGLGTARSATVNFRVNGVQEVVVAARELPRRMLVTTNDVRVERRAQSRVSPHAVRDLQAAVGKEIVRPVAPGEILTHQSLTAPVVIRRGSAVSLILEGPNFKILARGVAAEDGALGQSIRVVNQASRREAVGKVEDERTVRVPF